MNFVRIHSASESLETLLNPARRDGWVASDEKAESQPRGISCCLEEDDLRSYVRMYSMAIQPGDVLVRLVGRLSADRDRDQGAVRAIVESYEVIGDARDWFSHEGQFEIVDDEDEFN